MTNPKLIQQGAEAKIFLTKSDALTHPNNEKDKSGQVIIKARISKSYRIPELDKSIRKRRTKAEANLLKKASKVIDIPAIINVLGDKSNFANNPPEYSIKMEYINGQKLSEHLNNLSLEKQKKIMKLIGVSVAKLHKQDIIHGDLTTSNMILVEDKKSKLFFIDFGLGFISKKTEDKAVDLHLLKQALEAKHFQNWKTLFQEVEKYYEDILGNAEAKKIFERINAVEKRGRYRH